jgi:serine/threonine-protein kinase
MLDREGGLGWARAKPLVLQVCRALQSAHDKGILHRDVKPENCMRIARSDNPDFIKVLDFGLAKMLMAEAGVDVSLSIKGGGIMGTPEYMSPERIRGQTLDARSDVYALGVLAYELITGCVPYSGDHYTKVLDQQLNAAPVPLRKVSPSLDIGKGIEAVVLRALEKQPEGRFASAGEFADALERAETPAASPHAADTGAASRERTYRVIIVTLVVLVFVLSTVLLGQTFGWL